MNDSGKTYSAKIKDSFELHLEKTSEMVRNWPEWKKCIIGSSEPSVHTSQDAEQKDLIDYIDDGI